MYAEAVLITHGYKSGSRWARIEMTFRFCTDPHTDSRRVLPPLNDKTFRPVVFFKSPDIYFDEFRVQCNMLLWFYELVSSE